MKLFIRLIKTFRMFLIGLVSVVLLDMFVLKGFLKDLLVKANTSDYSPFSTDGQSNWVLVIVCLIGIAIVSRFILKMLRPEEKKEDEKNDETKTP